MLDNNPDPLRAWSLLKTQSLTDERKVQIQAILEQFDPENLTADSAQTISQAFREAGIHPGLGMREAIEAAGFDSKELRSLILQSEQATRFRFKATGISPSNRNPL